VVQVHDHDQNDGVPSDNGNTNRNPRLGGNGGMDTDDRSKDVTNNSSSSYTGT
jgi:hypothetical protein